VGPPPRAARAIRITPKPDALTPGTSVTLTGTFYTPDVAQAHRETLDALRLMTPEQVFETLVAAGIYAPDGQLLEPYAEAHDDDVEERPSQRTASR
jgi:hypothetical protein